MHGLFSLLAGCSNNSSKDSTYSLKEQCKSTTRASEPCSPAFKKVQARILASPIVPAESSQWSRDYQAIDFINVQIVKLCK